MNKAKMNESERSRISVLEMTTSHLRIPFTTSLILDNPSFRICQIVPVTESSVSWTERIQTLICFVRALHI